MSGERVKGRWGTRTIRPGGTVRWCGQTYRVVSDRREVSAEAAAAMSQSERVCVDVAYDGRLDGLRALFYEYPTTGAGPDSPLRRRIYLHSFGEEWPGPNCIDGVFRWTDWESA